MSGYVFDPQDIIDDDYDIFEHALAAVMTNAEPEPEDVVLTHLNGIIWTGCETQSGYYDVTYQKLLRVEAHYVVREEHHRLNPFAYDNDDFTQMDTRLYLIPRVHGEALASADCRISRRVFEKYISNATTRLSWRPLCLTVTAQPPAAAAT